MTSSNSLDKYILKQNFLRWYVFFHFLTGAIQLWKMVCTKHGRAFIHFLLKYIYIPSNSRMSHILPRDDRPHRPEFFHLKSVLNCAEVATLRMIRIAAFVEQISIDIHFSLCTNFAARRRRRAGLQSQQTTQLRSRRSLFTAFLART